MGKDCFTFVAADSRIIPVGGKNMLLPIDDKEPQISYFPLGCNRKNCALQCDGCAARVIDYGNMDYLHCDDLFWDGKHKCSD